MKPARWLTGFFLLGVLLLAACEGAEKQPQGGGAFIGGTRGLVTAFEPFGVEEQGTFTIFDSESFPIETTFRNKGEYDVQPGEIAAKLLGPAPEEFAGIPSRELRNQRVLDKISELTPDGGEETLTFGSEVRYAGEVSGAIDRDWFVNVEYRYKTFIIVPEVCLKEDLIDKRVCEVKGAKTFFVSGAPVTVTKVVEDTAGKGIMALKFTVRNSGNGDVTMPTAEFGIRDELSYSLDDPAWECTSGGKVNEARLREGEAEIICKLKQPLQPGDLFTKQVTLTLDYKYRELVQETLRIKQSVR